MKIVTVVGARPQFVKASALSKAIRNEGWDEILVHTGQHYDVEMSEVFFEELGLPSPDYNLGVGSGGHGEQTGSMLKLLEPIILDEQPDWVVVYGDTNSTLAGALCASKLHIPLAHVEAGLRSFDKRMPEEMNRIVADHLSDLLLCPSANSEKNLAREGITEGVHVVGDVMKEVILDVEDEEGIPETGSYALATMHRAGNTDDRAILSRIVEGLERVASWLPVLLPLHPRTRNALLNQGLSFNKVEVMKPVSFRKMVGLERNARIILTDSGGVQKEAYWLGVPCVTLRDETEWIETINEGWNTLVGSDPHRIEQASLKARRGMPPRNAYGGGRASSRVIKLLELGIAEPSPLSSKLILDD